MLISLGSDEQRDRLWRGIAVGKWQEIKKGAAAPNKNEVVE
ncbi:Hypothetical protein ETEE_1948 [Edwardsiella anguillarum ET080813]|uniref:Uncharacterized protein n=1 Tax=Edwardsiella anguillarum ET080813 TaxID=667120 RepID=A0A076LS18_9GAMM|nr:Hypothetical protein ETEE_1948 [Edwardsiella anguillarum ET080813]